MSIPIDEEYEEDSGRYGWFEYNPVRYSAWYGDIGAPHLGHSKHLCNMAKMGADLKMIKNLVKDAKFICKKCGRAAAKEENLCEPTPL